MYLRVIFIIHFRSLLTRHYFFVCKPDTRPFLQNPAQWRLLLLLLLLRGGRQLR